MKGMKKVISVILSLVIIFSAVSANMIQVYAGTVTEKEDNNSTDKATVFTTGSTVSGKLSSASDTDFYSFTVSKSGYVEIKFTNTVLTNSDSKWALNIYNADNLVNPIHSHVISATKGTTTLPKIGLTSGTYYIKISDGYRNYGYVNNVQYSIKVDFTATEYWESEFNSSFETADKISFSNSYGGYLYDASDKDYYEFTIANNGYIELDFINPVLTNSDSKWLVTVYKYADAYDAIHKHTVSGTQGKTELPKIGVTPGTYYITVEDGYRNYGYVNNVEYSINVDFTATEYWESELNSAYETADNISFSKTYGGYLYDASDKDYYKFTVAANGYVELDFMNPVLTNNDSKWLVTVYKYADAYDAIHKHTVIGTQGTTELPRIGVTPGTYYITVEDGYRSYGYVNNVEYKIKVDFTATDYWESEFNNEYTTADKIYGGKAYGGYLYDASDVDYYVFKVTQGGKIDIKFTNPILTNSDSKWSVILYKYSQAYSEVKSATVVATAESTTISSISVTAGTYYLRIADGYRNYGYVNNVEYAVTVSGDCVEKEAAKPVVTPTVKLGDVNEDGVVDAGDAILVSRYDTGLVTLTSSQLKAGDVNGDGTVDAGDAVIISRFDAGLISSLT